MLFYFISKTLHTALWLYNNTKNNFWFSSERFLLNFLYHYCFPESSKTPSWIRTSNRQYLLPKHEMLYSNVSHTRPKISVKTIAHQNVSTLFKKTKIWLCIICAPSFSIYILWCTYYIGSYYLDILMNSPPKHNI